MSYKSEATGVVFEYLLFSSIFKDLKIDSQEKLLLETYGQFLLKESLLDPLEDLVREVQPLFLKKFSYGETPTFFIKQKTEEDLEFFYHQKKVKLSLKLIKEGSEIVTKNCGIKSFLSKVFCIEDLSMEEISSDAFDFEKKIKPSEYIFKDNLYQRYKRLRDLLFDQLQRLNQKTLWKGFLYLTGLSNVNYALYVVYKNQYQFFNIQWFSQEELKQEDIRISTEGNSSILLSTQSIRLRLRIKPMLYINEQSYKVNVSMIFLTK